MAELNPDASLDLYARVEDLLGNEEAIDRLYAHYYDLLCKFSFGSLLDVGCGSGAFLERLQARFPHIRCKGIDLSGEMTARARSRGIEAEKIDLCEEGGVYDVITAVFDMVNYLPSSALKGFFRCIKSHLRKGGLFLFDINTRFGFEEVAVGAFTAQDGGRFVAIESDFEEGCYTADFTLFSKEQDSVCYRKESQTVTQFYHALETVVAASDMHLVYNEPISLYDLGEADKTIVMLER